MGKDEIIKQLNEIFIDVIDNDDIKSAQRQISEQGTGAPIKRQVHDIDVMRVNCRVHVIQSAKLRGNLSRFVC